MDKQLQQVRDNSARLFEEAKIAAGQRMDTYMTQHLKEIVDRSIEEFYDDYDPVRYSRRYSMYSLLTVGKDANGMYGEFDPSVMTYRPGKKNYPADGLYNQVFRKGWHGGAAGGEGHPDPGNPYWRYPSPYYHTWWSDAAPVAHESPLNAIKRRIDQFDNNAGPRIWSRFIEEEAIKRGLILERK